MLKRRHFALTAVLALSACKGGDAGNNIKDLNQRMTIASASSNFRELVIFYGNESPDTEVTNSYYERIDKTLAKLDTAEPNPVYQKIRTSYKQDRELFPAQVRKDVAGLKKQICEKRNVSNTGLFIFTNELARQGKFEYCLPDPYDGQIMTGDLEITIPEKNKDDFRYNQSPLALPGSMGIVRDAIKRELMLREMPETDYSYVWISKSHGGADMMITPKLLHKVDKLSDADLESHFRKVGSAASYGAMKFAELKVGDLKIGDLKVGDLKFGDLKVGDLKYGDLKVGDLKVGDLKVGDLKMSDLKFGDLKVGDLKVGDLKIGDLKVGDLKYGDLKVGDLKVGDLKVGDLKVGDLKYGDLKVGDLKVGDLKVGDLKYGDLKVGDLAAADETAEADTLGITKTRFLKEIKEFGLQFPVLFFESCSSELPESLILELKREATQRNYKSTIGAIYTSDKLGLKFETVDYGAMPMANKNSFSESLKAALDEIAAK